MRRCAAGSTQRFATARLGGLNLSARELRAFRRVHIVAGGSALYAGIVGAGMLESLARLPASAEPAAEFRYRNPVIEPDTLYVAVSQSGETADTLAAVEEIARKGGRVLGIVNVPGSSISRVVDGGIYLHAGPEMSVTSTKAFTCMAVAFALLALHLGRLRDLGPADGQRLIAGSADCRLKAAETLLDQEQSPARDLAQPRAERLLHRPRARISGGARGSAEAQGGLLHPRRGLSRGRAQARAPGAGRPRAADRRDRARDELFEKNLASLEQIQLAPRARAGGRPPSLGELADNHVQVPKSEPELDPILLGLPLQLLAYHAAVALGRDIDQPRNLAKSVTVE